MARTRKLSNIAYDEKEKMTARSSDEALLQKGQEEVPVCKECMAIYMNKRWLSSEEGSPSLRADTVRIEVLCPACQRIRDNNPAGVATFAGDYLAEHESEFLGIIRKVEKRARTRNPLARIIEIRQEGKVLIAFTTDDKLAQKLGREIYKEHSGVLEFQWSREDSFVRVNWRR